MNIIGLDTTTQSFCLGLVRDEKIADRIIVDSKGYQSEEFLVYLEKILYKHNLSDKEIDGYAISIGPGSLTGIRVGLAFLKGIGFATGCPVVPVKTLFAIAYEFREKREYICPILLTKRNKVFSAFYCFSSITTGHLLSESEGFSIRKSTDTRRVTVYSDVTVIEQSIIGIEELFARLPNKEVLFLGTGALKYRERIIDRYGERANFVMEEITHPDPANVALIGLNKIKKGNIPPLDKLEPIYL